MCAVCFISLSIFYLARARLISRSHQTFSTKRSSAPHYSRKFRGSRHCRVRFIVAMPSLQLSERFDAADNPFKIRIIARGLGIYFFLISPVLLFRGVTFARIVVILVANNRVIVNARIYIKCIGRQNSY